MKRYYGFVAVLAALAALVIGWEAVWSAPIKADQALVQRIESLQTKILEQAENAQALPADLSGLGDATGITYQRLSTERYQLCATFKTANHRVQSSASDANRVFIDATQHNQGYQCFAATVNLGGPQLLEPNH